MNILELSLDELEAFVRQRYGLELSMEDQRLMVLGRALAPSEKEPKNKFGATTQETLRRMALELTRKDIERLVELCKQDAEFHGLMGEFAGRLASLIGDKKVGESVTGERRGGVGKRRWCRLGVRCRSGL